MTEERPPSYGDIEDEQAGQEVIDDTYTDQPDPGGCGESPADGGSGVEPPSAEGFHGTISPNGVSAETGRPVLPSIAADDLVAKVFGGEQARPEEVPKVVPPGLRWNELSEVGWGVIVSKGDDEEVLGAVSELMKLRESQADVRYRKLEYEPGESARQFLARYQVGPGVIDPTKVPYYLLIVGDPRDIPFSFQYQLAAGYAVGRLSFDDPESYRRYARTVVEAETRGAATPEIVSFFGVDRDPTTRRSTRELIAPLSERLIRAADGWRFRTWLRGDATKSRLGKILGGSETPGLLVASSHGVVYASGDGHQLARQGGLLCQEWSGPGDGPRALTPGDLFTAEDVSPGADLRGLFAFLFACYSAGTPRDNDFVHENGGEHIAPHPFVARLPQKLLEQGALGVIGHVDRAWTCTYSWTEEGGQVQTPASVLELLMKGHRAGHAMSYFGHRYAELATQLTEVWEQFRRKGTAAEDQSSAFLAWLWTAHNDARNMVLLGDPAARRVEVGR